MSRSKWKTLKLTKSNIQHRANTISPNFLNKEISVHNGKIKKIFTVKLEHVGHKFGEFVPTKIIAKYTKNAK